MTIHTLDPHPDQPHTGVPPLDAALRHVRAFELEARDVRITHVETHVATIAKTQDDLLDLVQKYAVDHAELRTTIKIASAAAIVLIPLLASFGAWLVLRQLQPTQQAAAVTLPDIPITAVASNQAAKKADP